MLEKAPEEEFGGNARYSHTGFRFVYSESDDIREIVPDWDAEEFARFHIPAYTEEIFKGDLYPGFTPQVTSSGCSFITIRLAPVRPAMRYLAGRLARMPLTSLINNL
jgi:hypothetical protein